MIEAQIIRRPDYKWDVVLVEVQRDEYNSVPGSPVLGLSPYEALMALKRFEESGAVRPDANLFVFDGKGGKLHHGSVARFLLGEFVLEDAGDSSEEPA